MEKERSATEGRDATGVISDVMSVNKGTASTLFTKPMPIRVGRNF